MVAKGDLAMLYGPWGSYKSFLALGLAAAIADGTRFLERDTEQGLALVVCGEGGPGIADRLKAATAVSRIQNAQDPIHKWLGIACSMPALTEPTGFDQTCRAIDRMGAVPALLIVDTFARASAAASLDENSTADMGRLVAALDRLRSQYPECAILVVHHSGNDRNDRSRGSSALPAACDSILRVDPVRGRGTKQVKLLAMKVKDGQAPPPMVVNFAVAVVREERGRQVSSLRVDGCTPVAEAGEQKNEIDKLHEAIRQRGPQPAATLIPLLGLQRSAGSDRLSRFVKAGQLVCIDDGAGRAHRYDLPDSMK